jgi:hypothetical protein
MAKGRKKLVEVTNTSDLKRYAKSYGEPEMCIVHDEDPLELDVVEILSSDDEIYQIELQREPARKAPPL